MTNSAPSRRQSEVSPSSETSASNGVQTHRFTVSAPQAETINGADVLDTDIGDEVEIIAEHVEKIVIREEDIVDAILVEDHEPAAAPVEPQADQVPLKSAPPHPADSAQPTPRPVVADIETEQLSKVLDRLKRAGRRPEPDPTPSEPTVSQPTASPDDEPERDRAGEPDNRGDAGTGVRIKAGLATAADTSSDDLPDNDLDLDLDNDSDDDTENETPTPPSLLEFRQVAGLTAGAILDLTEEHYDFAEGEGSVGFSISVDEHDRAIVTPGSVDADIDSIPLEEPTVLGSGVLDVGSARFIVRARREDGRAADWLDQHRKSDQADPIIEVPTDLTVPKPARKRRLGRRRSSGGRSVRDTLDAGTWEFIESVRETRSAVAEKQRFLHPDPSELRTRVEHGAPILGIRSGGHDLFGQVGVIMADVPWLPTFDDIHAIPELVGYEVQPLLSLPSVPIPADLLRGPLGLVGARIATMACARHILLSLYALSTADLRLHVVTSPDRGDAWSWASVIAPERPLLVEDGFSVVLIDGMENFDHAGFEHHEAIEHRIGVVILADSVDELPSYCGTVLQIDGNGGAVLSDHQGDLIPGTPVGMTTATAGQLADDLSELMVRRARA